MVRWGPDRTAQHTDVFGLRVGGQFCMWLEGSMSLALCFARCASGGNCIYQLGSFVMIR